MPTISLSRSKKALLFYPGDGRVYMTSVRYMKMLLEGKAKGNMLVMIELNQARDGGVGVVDNVKKEKNSFNWDSLE